MAAFEQVEEAVVQHPAVAHQQAQHAQVVLGQILGGLLNLKALSQRFVVALSQLFALSALASVFVLFMVIRDPSVYQLIALGGYSAFILIALFIVKGR